MTDGSPSHAALMDKTYRYQRLFYDLTRRFYLLGRDRLIAELAPPPQGRILEIACGTGRNLKLIGRRYRDCELFGLDISTEMLRSAQASLGDRARLACADACRFDAEALFGTAHFDRIILSYAASMIPDWTAALTNATAHLAPGGQLHVVDFGSQSRLPRWFGASLRAWLAAFHVTPRDDLRAVLTGIAAQTGTTLRFASLYRDYASYAVLTRPA